jgi:hypothetical protein
MTASVEERMVEFAAGDAHKAVYQDLYMTACKLFTSITRGDSHVVWDNYMDFADVLLRLRQCCSHGSLGQRSRFEGIRKILEVVTIAADDTSPAATSDATSGTSNVADTVTSSTATAIAATNTATATTAATDTAAAAAANTISDASTTVAMPDVTSSNTISTNEASVINVPTNTITKDKGKASDGRLNDQPGYSKLKKKLTAAMGKIKADECAKYFDQIDVDDAIALRKCKHELCVICLYKTKFSMCPFCGTEFASSDIVGVGDMKDEPRAMPKYFMVDHSGDEGEVDDTDDNDGKAVTDNVNNGVKSSDDHNNDGRHDAVGAVSNDTDIDTAGKESGVAEAVMSGVEAVRGKAGRTDREDKLNESEGPPQKMARLSSVYEDDQNLGQSPKIKALLAAIEELEANTKCVVLIQWSVMLDIIRAEFDRLGYPYCTIDGKQSMEQNLVATESFNGVDLSSTDSPRFVLCTVQACARYINLYRTGAVLLMDCIWDVEVDKYVSIDYTTATVFSS